jgi:pre-mRNA-processing factor 40
MREKVLKRSEDEKHAADRHQRRAIDALRSRIKHLEPPVRPSDSWNDVRPRVERSEEYKALDSEEARISAFEKVIKRLREKEEDADRDRDRRRPRRSDDRDHRNGHRDSRHGRLSRSPEIDPYEADRRKAMAARERQYRKSATSGLSPPPDPYRERDRDRDRRRGDDRHGRLDRSPGRRAASPHDRDRRDREDERERLYRARGDPRGSRDELNYGDDTKSVAGSERRRRRESDGESVASTDRRSAKRHRRERRESRGTDRRSKTPQTKEEPAAEPAGVHSGSEEGEIEED